jgi:hypothetical protein
LEETGADEASAHDVARINAWLCAKRMNKFDEVRDSVVAFEPKTRKGEIGRLALLEESRPFFRLIRSMVADGELDLADAEEFPVFEEMRVKPAYKRFRREHSPRPADMAALLDVQELDSFDASFGSDLVTD